MITRNDYLSGKVNHRQYYAQFVTPQIKNLVEKFFGKPRLEKSYDWDISFNNIPLSKWDCLAEKNILSNWEIRSMLAKAGDGMTLAGAVCILKEAARQVVESN